MTATDVVRLPRRRARTREDLTADLDRRLRDGEGIALVGPAGIGKSVMADDLAVALAGTHHVVRVQGRRSALDIPMGAFEAVLPPGIDQVRVALTRVRDQLQVRRSRRVGDRVPRLFERRHRLGLNSTSPLLTAGAARGSWSVGRWPRPFPCRAPGSVV